jgi:hypothetical protein
MTIDESSYREVSGIKVIPRQTFFDYYWEYKAGEHVTFLGPTQTGKTTLSFQLLGCTAMPDLPAVILVVKPKDGTVTKWAKRFDYRIIRDWPPPPHYRVIKPKGYVVWPRHSFNSNQDDAKHSAIMHRAINGCYKSGDKILFADETWGLTKELGLERELNRVWSRGAAMGCGLWSASQRPFAIPQLAYSSAEHLFVCNDPDERDRKRFSEIGGVDPKLVSAVSLSLQKYQWLYIRRTGPELCIVDKD